MKVCIVSDGLVSLTLANVLIQKGIFVDIYVSKKNIQYDQSRTLGISKSNVDYFNNEIVNIKKILWEIKNIKIYTEKDYKNELLNFDNKDKQIFSIIRNYQLKKILLKRLKKNKFIKFKHNFNIDKSKYKLVINSDPNHLYIKKFFSKKIEKNYNSYAYTTTINHKKLSNNDVAIQIFTDNGPIAFLPISNVKTSVVYSVKDYRKINLGKEIKKYNSKYFINSIDTISKFKLKSSNSRHYHHHNILAFGDLLHKIHPLAGQGFNMTIRDIKVLLELIKFRIEYGLELDRSIFIDFEKKTKHKNYIFSNSIDFVYEFFSLERKIKNPFLKKSIKFVGENRYANNFFKKFADHGIVT